MQNIIKYRVIGVMSGTSLDGLDLALCVFTKQIKWQYKIEKTKTIKYTKFWKNKLENLHLKTKDEISKTDIDFGIYIGKKIKQFVNTNNVDLICSHGHTIFHQPDKNFTLQIGDGRSIANTTKTKTINDFRSLDISLFGQGAPLVPIGDLKLFNKYKYCLNLGGFANISIKKQNKIQAFDICPVNIILNKLAKRLNLEYDKNGEIAKSGNIIKEVLDQLNQIPFYKKNPPKSLSREWVEKFIHPIISNNYNVNDLLRTYCEHISIQINKNIKNESTLVTGGGALNNYLIKCIKKKSSTNIIIANKDLIEFKEALIFGFLGILKDLNEINCLASVTGAKHDCSSGKIHIP